MGFPEIEAGSEMPMWFIAFYEQYVRQRNEMLGMMTRYAPSVPPYRAQESIHEKPRVVMTESSEAEEFGVVDLEHGAVDPMVLRKMSMEITLLEGGILFHSVFVGMTVSLTTEGFIVLLIAILFHQTFEGLGLGSRIAAVPYPKGSWKPWALIFAFGTTAPIGQAIGLITRNTYDPNSAFALILVGFFNAFSSGLLIYAGLVDLLHADFLSEEADRVLTNKKKMLAFSFVLMGGEFFPLQPNNPLKLTLCSGKYVHRGSLRVDPVIGSVRLACSNFVRWPNILSRHSQGFVADGKWGLRCRMG